MVAARTATVYALVAVLLACPYPCLSQASACAGGADSTHRGKRDACCSGCASETGNDRPDESRSGSAGGTCLCHGAVVERPASPANPDHLLMTLLPRDALLNVRPSFSFERGLPTEPAARHFPAAHSGREVRAFMESLLL